MAFHRSLRLLSLVLLLSGMSLAGMTGCKQDSGPGHTESQPEQKTYHLVGRIVSSDAAAGTVTVQHEAVPGYMGAMTMPYGLANPTVAGELHRGDRITATLVVPGGHSDPPMMLMLKDLVVTDEADPNALPVMQYHVPKPGDAVPDFHLLNQSGKQIDLAQFRGRVLLLTFIYTRCPLADYCPRMSSNFAVIDDALKADPAVYAKTHLLSISFDPRYDTPAVLRSYGGAHTGRFTQEDFRHWDFAAPNQAELPKLEEWFDLGVTPARPGDPTVLTHSLSTVLVGKDGKVLGWFPTNDWKPADLAAQMKAAAQ